MKTIYDLILNEGKTFIGENAIINICKQERLKGNFYTLQKENYPFFETISTNLFFYDYNNKSGQPMNYWLTGNASEYKRGKELFVALVLNPKFKINSSEIKDDTFSSIKIISDESEYTDFLYLNDSVFFVQFNLEKLRNFYNEEAFSEEIRKEIKDFAKEIIFNSINNRRGLVYSLEYFPFYETKRAFKPCVLYYYFFGETMNKNGIENLLKNKLKEDTLKPLALIPMYEEDIKKVWNKLRLLICPANVKLSIPEIDVIDMEELVELQIEGESEIFSKDLFVIETMFYDKGKIGEKLQEFVKRKIMDSKK